MSDLKLDKTFMTFLLEHQMKNDRTLNFVILMDSIVTAAQYINYYYYTGVLKKNSGEANTQNATGDSVMSLDLLANTIVLRYLSASQQVAEAVSEELTEEVILTEDGRYFIYFDPLDGSSNIKHSLPVGFMFGIAKRNLNGAEDHHIRKGSEFIASGIFLIPTGMFVFALKDAGAWRFVKDEANIYVRPEKMMFPESKKKWELSYNSSNFVAYAKNVQKWLYAHVSLYGFRYAGALAVDFYRLLNNGGMFLYPAIVNHADPSKNRPNGKLRLMYEANVVAMIAKEAGGTAVNEKGDYILDIKPTHRHERTALYIGNKEVVEEVRAVLKGGPRRGKNK